MLIHVHELAHMGNQQMSQKMKVRITAGREVVKTKKHSKGIFQTTLTIKVEQGTEYIVIDLMSEVDVLLARAKLHVKDDILAETKTRETVQNMKEMSKCCPLNPALRLTFCHHPDMVAEGMISSHDPETAMLLQQKLDQASERVAAHDHVTDLEILSAAIEGPVDVFGKLGATTRKYMAAMGPPFSRRYCLGLWKDKSSYEEHQNAQLEIDILKVHSVQADPHRPDVFIVSYFNNHKIDTTQTFRIVEKTAKLWVQLLHIFITKAHDNKRAERMDKRDKDKQFR
eukprot:CAMPEP_0117521036 /NCGR_PEP_ID=MMETSP0784-20121206/33476_1 /TAXON_ID=39447 /ORGANISM="" /LENGTH=283 /DNA_ID=CAMNT_0005317047 /DNA_START=180 /DNA_END=1031 /DNA_ORIENTATION=+